MSEEKKSGCLKYLAIGCVIMVILSVIAAVVVFFGARSFVSGMAEKYTEKTPRALPVPVASQQESDAVIKRADEFADAIKQDKSAPELVLSANDINILINKHPEFKKAAGMVNVEIDGDKIGGQLSVPLGEFSSMFKGQYLNGSGVFRTSIEYGRLMVFADSIEVRGEKLPASFMKSFSTGNLAEKVNEDPRIAPMLQRIESISVRDGSIHVVPKKKLQ